VYSPVASRANLDLRAPSRIGDMRMFIEGDFAGSGNTARLRHAFIQARHWMVGQTWSTFSDPEAEPIGIDFEGLNAISLFRQPQVRWSFPLGQRLRMAIALEDPKPDVTNATAVNQIPDLVTRLRWEPKGGGHIQFSTLVRQLRADSTDSEEIVATGRPVPIRGFTRPVSKSTVSDPGRSRSSSVTCLPRSRNGSVPRSVGARAGPVVAQAGAGQWERLVPRS